MTQPTGRLRGPALVLSRQFRAPVEDVWKSVTDPDSTARWFGRWEGTPGAGNQIRIQMIHEDGAPWTTKTIEVCDAPHRLVVSSSGPYGMRLELALRATAEGCELELVHHDVDPKQVGDFGPGWEFYLDCLVASREDRAAPKFADYYPAQKAYFTSLAG